MKFHVTSLILILAGLVSTFPIVTAAQESASEADLQLITLENVDRLALHAVINLNDNYYPIDVDFSPDGMLMAVAEIERGTEPRYGLRLWNMTTLEELVNPAWNYLDARSVSFSSDGERLAVATAREDVVILDAASGEVTQVLRLNDGPITEVEFSPDGTMVAVAVFNDSARYIFRLIDLATTLDLVVLTTEGNQGRGSGIDVAFGDAGIHVAVVLSDGTVDIFNVAARQRLSTFDDPDGSIHSVEFAPDNRFLVMGTTEGALQLWWYEGIEPELSVDCGHQWVTSVDFNVDGTLIAGCGYDGVVRLWDGETLALVTEIEGHADSILHFEFSSDGALLASASIDGTLRLWGIPAGE
jgi:WD40 repeat protein